MDVLRLAVLFGLGLVLINCKGETVSLQSPPEGPRTYTWTVDTLVFPGSLQTNMRNIYGTSRSNVYVVGHNEGGYGRIHHYDGVQWRPADITYINGAFEDIDGSGPADIWIAGAELSLDPITNRINDSSMVIRFNGGGWTKQVIPKSTGLNCLKVHSPVEVWAGSSTGALLHYYGTGWTKYELGRELFITSIACIAPAEVYCVAYRDEYVPPLDSTAYFLYRFNGASWSAIDTVWELPGSPPPHFGLTLSAWGGELYSHSPNIYKRVNGRWELVVTAEVGRMWRNSPTDIIASGRGLYHYNGRSWNRIMTLSPSPGMGIYSDGTEVFVVGNDNSKTIIVHGR